MTTATPPPRRRAVPRHAAREPGRPRRGARRFLVPALGVSAALALGIPALRATGADGNPGGSCGGGTRTLDIAAAPELSALLDAAVHDPGSPVAADPCLRVDVQPRDPADVAAALSRGERGAVDAWVPDSSLWLDDAALPHVAGSPASLASSPVVLALARSDAERLGWPDEQPDVAGALTRRASVPQRLALADPRTSAPARMGLVELAALVESQPDGRTLLARAFRVADRSVPDQSAALATAGRGGLLVPASEQAVQADAERRGAAAVVAWYPPGGPVLDYPLVPVTDDPAALEDLATLSQSLAADSWQRRLTDVGFRTADGTAAAAGSPAETGVDARPLPGLRVPDRDAVERASRAYDLLGRGMRMLAVLDVSGSMAQEVPGSGTTRMDAATRAAAQGLGLLPDDAQVGLWVFSTDLTPATDHRELVPIGSLGPRADGLPGRQTLAQALSDVQFIADGDTGLYDTVLAAVREVREEWDPERVNSVVLITDGRNDDVVGTSLPGLLEALRREGGERPVPVIGIAYGPDSDLAALQEISRATGGSTYHAHDPRRIAEVLEDALAQRPCRPDC